MVCSTAEPADLTRPPGLSATELAEYTRIMRSAVRFAMMPANKKEQAMSNPRKQVAQRQDQHSLELLRHHGQAGDSSRAVLSTTC